jgi:acetyl-CoA synthetase
VPKAYVTLTAGTAASADTAFAIMAYARQRLAPYQRVRRLEFAELPKTISGKIRRVQLRAQEDERHQSAEPSGPSTGRGVTEFWEEDFPELKS